MECELIFLRLRFNTGTAEITYWARADVVAEEGAFAFLDTGIAILLLENFKCVCMYVCKLIRLLLFRWRLPSFNSEKKNTAQSHFETKNISTKLAL